MSFKPMLEESITAFESLGLSGLTAAEALNRVVLRAQIPQESMSWLAQLERIIFIPSAQSGPALVRLGGLSDTIVRFLFGARIPAGTPIRSPAVSRSELLMRLNALANDTRLRVLELLGQKGELGLTHQVLNFHGTLNLAFPCRLTNKSYRKGYDDSRVNVTK
jgi:hypothetical protein